MRVLRVTESTLKNVGGIFFFLSFYIFYSFFIVVFGVIYMLLPLYVLLF